MTLMTLAKCMSVELDVEVQDVEGFDVGMLFTLVPAYLLDARLLRLEGPRHCPQG